jgi:hypothetical protein
VPLLVSSSSSRGLFLLVLVSIFFFSFFLFGGWAEKSPKNRQKMTQFSENEIFSVKNSLFLGKKTIA